MGTLPASHTGTQGGDCTCLLPFLSLSCLPAPLWLAALTLGLGPLVSMMLHVGACTHVGMLRVPAVGAGVWAGHPGPLRSSCPLQKPGSPLEPHCGGPGCLGVPRGSVSVSRSPQSQWAISRGWCIGVRVLWRLKRGGSQWLELLSLGNAEIQSSRSWAGSSLEGVRAGTATKCRIRKSFWSHVFPCAVRYKCTNVCPGIYMSRCVQACVNLWVAEGQWP